MLALAAVAQTIVFLTSGSIALLADLIHNFGDASTAIPLGAAFLLRSACAERWAGLFVVAAIFVSACVAGPLIGLGITAVILKITWDSWRTVRGHAYSH